MTWTVPVLFYHHVAPRLRRYTNAPPGVLERHLAWLSESYSFWTLGEAQRAFARGTDPSAHVVLTFDDAYEDVFAYGRRLLDRYRIRATFFVIATHVGGFNVWNERAGYRARHMSWSQLTTLQDEGHEIGSHGMSHRPLDGLSPDDAAVEVKMSRALIETGMGRPVTSFAYPYGRFLPNQRTLVADSYTLSVSTVKSRHRDWSLGTHFLRRCYVPTASTRQEALAIIEKERSGREA